MLAAPFGKRKRPTSNSTSEGNVIESVKDGNVPTKNAASPPTTIELRGVQIHFPFKPYKCQEDYMGKVIDALNRSENALLESPTGTGKTLCLLCSTLAWQTEQSVRIKEDSHTTSPTKASLKESAPLNAATNTTSSVKTTKKPPTIIYASRTHSQLSQVVKELRFTRYRPKHAVLGSREQMCVNSKVKTKNATANDINHACGRLTKDRKCRFRNNLDGFVPSSAESDGISGDFGLQPVLDIEELTILGKKRNICPFYFSRGHIADAEIIFVPYNYLFDKDARSTSLADVHWENSILVFDEAHNLEAFASDAASFDLGSVDIAGCINEVQRAIGYSEAMPEVAENIKMENLARLKGIFLKFERFLDHEMNAAAGSFSGEYIFEIFAKGASINYGNHAIFLKFVKQVTDMIMEMRADSSGRTSTGTPKLDHFVQCVKRVFGTATEGQCLARARAYRVHISQRVTTQSLRSKTENSGGFVGTGNASNVGRVLSYWCFAPSLAMNELAALKVRSILITSGTLSPLPSYSLELGLSFPHTIENSHIISKDQISVRVISKGVSGKALTSTYNRRNDSDYILELGNTIISLCRVIPGGVLIFFPSYGVMETCVEKWGGPMSSRSFAERSRNSRQNFFKARKGNVKNSGSGRFCFPHAPGIFGNMSGKNSTPWQRLLSIKAMVLEPRTTVDLKDCISEFEKYLSSPKSTGCILMGVCRGKISEGIDFADDKCRAVIITGLPFAPYLDPKVKLKREFLDSLRKDIQSKPSGDGGFGSNKVEGSNIQNPPLTRPQLTLSGGEWYSQQAHRAVNQAVGRVIRHRSDYGAILFLDSRFGEERNQMGVSKWIRPNFVADNGVGSTIGSLVKFYRHAEKKAAACKSALLIESHKSKAKPVKLEYETDASNEEMKSEVTKFAIIRNDTSDTDNNNLLDGYVRPEQVIRQVELRDKLNEKKIHIEGEGKMKTARNGLQALYKPSNKFGSMRNSKNLEETISLAWDISATKGLKSSSSTKTKPIIPNVIVTKSKPSMSSNNKASDPARRFFNLGKETLSKEDFQTVFKYVMSMKKSGDMRDKKSYFKSAKMLIELLQRDSENKRNSNEECLIELLFQVLPVPYRQEIKTMACEMLYERSKLKVFCDDQLSQDELDVARKIVLNVLYVDPPISDLRRIVLILFKYQKEDIDCPIKKFLSLVQTHRRRAVSSLVEEIISSERIKLMKKAERKGLGEDSVNHGLFRKSNSLVEVKEQKETVEADDEFVMREALSRAHSKTASADEDASKRLNEAIESSRKVIQMKNPYKKKIGTGTNSVHSHSRPSKRAKSIALMAQKSKSNLDMAKANAKEGETVDPFDHCLRQATAETFKNNDHNSRIALINSRLKSRNQGKMSCPICESESNEPYMAECGHYACSMCWNKWFKRSDTCPQCRKPTSKKSLTRVILSEPGSASFTQLCESDDEELEILLPSKTS